MLCSRVHSRIALFSLDTSSTCRSRTLLSYAEGRPLEIHNWRAGNSSLPRFIPRSLPLCLRGLHNKPMVGCGINGLIPGSFSSVSTTPTYCVAALQFTASLAPQLTERAVPPDTLRPGMLPCRSTRQVTSLGATSCSAGFVRRRAAIIIITAPQIAACVCVCTSSNCCSVNKTPRRAVKVNHSLVAFKLMSSFLSVSHLSRTMTTVLENQTTKA